MAPLGAVAIAVEAFETERDALERPIRDADEPLIFQRIDRTIFEGWERAAADRDDGGRPAERLTVAEIGVEIEVALAHVAKADEEPGNGRALLNRLVAIPSRDDPVRCQHRRLGAVGIDRHAVPELAIAGAERFK
jgi:hypothetical protein